MHKANVELIKRYKKILANVPMPQCMTGTFNNEYLVWMLDQIKDNPGWPLDKSGRWMGFVQGIMCFRGFTTVDAEREFSRPLFHKVYTLNGVEIPKSINKKE